MTVDAQVLEKIDRIEATSRRWRPFVVGGLLMIVVGIGFLIAWLESERRAEKARVAEMEARVATIVRELEADRRARGSSPHVERAIAIAGQLPAVISRAPEAETPITGSGFGAMRFDFLFCQSAGRDARDLAARLAASRPAGAGGEWRARPFAANRNPDFRFTYNAIRFEESGPGPHERQAAELMQRYLRSRFGVEAQLQPTTSNTAGIVSVFLCEGAEEAPLPASTETTTTNGT